jgi:hypothetical protein
MSDQQQPAKKQLDRKIAARFAAVQLVIGFITLRDIKKRGKEGVRGPRILWKVWGSTNTLGSVMYWKFGRRKVELPAESES